MITANEAKRKSIINARGKEYLDRLEKYINKAIADGKCSTTMGIDLTESSSTSLNRDNDELKNAIVEELVRLGYKVDFKYAKEMPAGCRSDQWDFNNGYIKVEW